MREAASLAAEIETAVTGIRDDLQAAYEAREQALPLCRSAIRHAANCIRAVHRGELDRAEELLAQCRASVGEAATALRDFPSILHAGFVHDAQKEYAEASVTLALVAGRPLPAPEARAGGGPAGRRRGCTLTIVGLHGDSLAMSLALFPLKLVTVRGAFVGTLAELRELMDLAKAGRVAPIPISVRPMAEATAALDDLKAGRIVGRAVLRN